MSEQQRNFDGFWLSLSLAEQKIIRSLAVMSFGELGVPLPDLESSARLDADAIEEVVNKLEALGYVEKGKLLGNKEDTGVEVIKEDDFLTTNTSVADAMKIVRATFKGELMLANYKNYKAGLKK
jgi:hypothetical protein